MKYSEYMQLFLHVLQHEVYQDPDKGKVVADSVTATTPNSQDTAYSQSIYVNYRKFVRKIVHIERVQMSKSGILL